MRWSGPLADRIAIRELIEAYGDAVFRRDADAFAETWAEDAEWHIMGETRSGRDAIRTHWATLMEGFAFAAMFWTGGGCRIDWDRGSGSWYALEMLHRKGGEAVLVCGRYEDEYVRDAGGVWRFARRRYTMLHSPN